MGKEWSIAELIAENRGRNEALKVKYDPIKGIGCCGMRERVAAREWNDGMAWVPAAMKRDKGYKNVRKHEDWVKLRCRYDFE